MDIVLQDENKYLEKEIKKLFEKENIGICTERWIKATRQISKDEVEYNKNLRIRLKQGKWPLKHYLMRKGVLCKELDYEN